MLLSQQLSAGNHKQHGLSGFLWATGMLQEAGVDEKHCSGADS